jgi:hypothetical protein
MKLMAALSDMIAGSQRRKEKAQREREMIQLRSEVSTEDAGEGPP